MSQWTHVAAVIRFDCIRFAAMGFDPPAVDPVPQFADGTAPTGSEGPLHIHLWANPSENSVAAYTATIWGDLRDYDDHGAIIAWLEKHTATWEHGIRSGVVEIDVEGLPPIVAHCMDDGRWVRVSPKPDLIPQRIAELEALLEERTHSLVAAVTEVEELRRGKP